MSATHHTARRPAALLAMILIALAALPAAAIARPAPNGVGPRDAVYSQPTQLQPAPTVLRTVVQDDPMDVLPVALAGAALIIALGATGYMLVRVAPLRHQLGGEH